MHDYAPKGFSRYVKVAYGDLPCALTRLVCGTLYVAEKQLGGFLPHQKFHSLGARASERCKQLGFLTSTRFCSSSYDLVLNRYLAEVGTRNFFDAAGLPIHFSFKVSFKASMMHIQRITHLTDLHPYRERWDALAGDSVFRSWDWLTTWWQHYGEGRQLYVLLVFAEEETASCQTTTTCSDATRSSDFPVDSENLQAILPCYVESHFARGQVLRLLGDGEICSDHLDLLSDPAEVAVGAQAIARFLCENASDWDTTEFTAIGVESVGLVQLCEELGSLGCHVTRKPNQNCWAISLPDDWEAFLAMQSKSHRKQLRRLERRVLDTEQAVWHLVETPTDFEKAWPILIDLHQRRRVSLGEPGCFASERWAAFHRDIARQLLDAGKLRLSWLELAGQPVAAEYHFAGERTTWAYQGGVHPDRIAEEPGQLSMIRTLQHALAEGHQQFDLLRGDEPYKAHWRAQPQETFDLQIVPARSAARWRWQACNTLHRAVRLARQLTNMLS